MNRLARAATLALSLWALPAGAIEITEVTSPMGHTGWLVHEPSIPFASIEVVFTGGASLDTPMQSGAVSLMTSLLTEGAGDYDAQGFASALESLAGSVGFDARRDSVTMTIRALSENRDQVVDLALTALTEPHFDQISLERVRAQTVASLQRAARNPDTLAQRAFSQAGHAGHPYALAVGGTPDTVAALTLDAILDAHRAAFSRDLVYFGAAGDITAEEFGALMDRVLADLPTMQRALPDYRTFAAEPGVTVVDFDGPQASVQFGHAGIRWDDPDFMAAFVMNEIFGGGGFGSRLMRELRETRGLTYGVYTGLNSGRFGDSFGGRFSTANASVGEAIALVREQFEWLANGGITQEDLERIQTYLTGAYPLRFDGNEAIAGILASMQFNGFPLNYINVRNDLVRAVTLADIHRVAQRLAQPEALRFVVVGRPEGLE